MDKKELFEILGDFEIHQITTNFEGYLGKNRDEIIYWPIGDHNAIEIKSIDSFLNILNND